MSQNNFESLISQIFGEYPDLNIRINCCISNKDRELAWSVYIGGYWNGYWRDGDTREFLSSHGSGKDLEETIRSVFEEAKRTKRVDYKESK